MAEYIEGIGTRAIYIIRQQITLIIFYTKKWYKPLSNI